MTGKISEEVITFEGFCGYRGRKSIDLSVRDEKRFLRGRYFTIRDRNKIVLAIKLPNDYNFFKMYTSLLDATRNGFVEFDEKGELERIILVPTRKLEAKQKQYSPKMYYWKDPEKDNA